MNFKEATMRRASGAIGAMILAIAIYFTLFWGYDALRILTSPTYGLEDVWRSQVVFGIGRYAGFGPEALIKLAAALGAVKLAIAGVCAVHVFERLRALFAKTAPANEMFETALILAVGISVASLVPAIWSQNADLAREHTIQLFLAGLTGAFCMVERSGKKAEAPAVEQDMPQDVAIAPAVAETSASFNPWRR
jgi:hypothetical protein